MTEPFQPKYYLKNPFLQTILGSLKLDSEKNNRMLDLSRETMLSVGKDIRLKGAFSKNPVKKPKGLFILLHGWEGSEKSTYILRTGKFLFEKGFDIFRLNLRDHGDTHDLNVEPFNGSLLGETYEGIYQASKLAGKMPVYLCGFSLGGNFCLRIALKSSGSKKKIRNLKHTFAISPAINPYDTTVLMDEHIILRKYFMRSWWNSLSKKESLHPERYPFSELPKSKTVMELTEKIIQAYTPFKDAREYFDTYTLLGNYFKNLKSKVTVLTAKDDPIISVQDFLDLKKNRFMDIRIAEHGGHNGFVKNLSFDCYYTDVLEEIIS